MGEAFRGFLEGLGLRLLVASFPPALLLLGGWPFIYGLALFVSGESELGLDFMAAPSSMAATPLFWAAVVILAFGFILVNRMVVQLWEGYPWLGLLRRIEALRAKLSRRRSVPEAPLEAWRQQALASGSDALNELADESARPRSTGDRTLPLRSALGEDWAGAGLPLPVDITLPTEVGRVLRRAEFAPFMRYGIDSMELWARMTLFIPSKLLSQYQGAKTWLDLGLNLATVFALLAPAPLIATRQLRGIGLAVALALTSYIAYRSAVTFAEIMRRAFETSFDLYRGDLLKAWGLCQPDTIEKERPLWRVLSAYLKWGDPALFPGEYRLPGPAGYDPCATAPRMSGVGGRLRNPPRGPLWSPGGPMNRKRSPTKTETKPVLASIEENRGSTLSNAGSSSGAP